MIEAALKDTRGRVSGPTGAAVKLGIPRSTLESKIRSLKINKNRFRPLRKLEGSRTIFGQAARRLRSALKWQDNHPKLGKLRIKL